MTLTVGSGPFGHRPGGEFNFEVPRRGVQYIEPFPRRIRAFIGGDAVLDTIGAKLLHEQRRLPVWVFPPADVQLDRFGEGDVWSYEDGLAEGLVGVRWGAAERWLEEEEEVIVHLRDPYHRIELRETSRVVSVELDGVTLAQSIAPLALFETSLPTRWYMPRTDLRAELIATDAVRTGCAYKGWASYEDVRVGDRVEPFLAWHYAEPLRGMERICGLVCFFNERVDLRLDGELQPRPRSVYSNTEWARAEWAREPAARASHSPVSGRSNPPPPGAARTSCGRASS